jgi:beta-glucanase (GH16 family)
VLTITAREEQVGGRDYSSARITTQNKFDVQYGRIEARIKLPYGQGLWPAFWMLGANFSDVGWPYCGEIDIMEMVGGENKDNTCHATMHWWDDTQNLKTDYGLSYTLPSGRFADDFHVFGITWNAQEIRAYVDDNEYFVASLTPAELSEFRQNFFIILNVAVGGNWPGSPDETTVFPQTMQVDWIRVYAN